MSYPNHTLVQHHFAGMTDAAVLEGQFLQEQERLQQATTAVNADVLRVIEELSEGGVRE